MTFQQESGLKLVCNIYYICITVLKLNCTLALLYFISYHSDSKLYEKVSTALTNPRLVKGIKQASPLDQTSCLEGFHSVLNQFSPKMIAYWYQGQYCRLVVICCMKNVLTSIETVFIVFRHILALVHFNFNLHRDTKTRSDKSESLKFTYPKFKNGEATVRNVKVAPDFCKFTLSH